MTECIAVTKSGAACRFNAREGSDKCGHHTAWQPALGRCEAITAAGSQCTNKRNNADSTTCRMHRNSTRTIQVEVPPVVLQLCTHPGAHGAPCGRGVKRANVHNECTFHARMRRSREASERRVVLYRRVLGMYRDQRVAVGYGGVDQNAENALVNEWRNVAMRAFRTIVDANRHAIDVTEDTIVAVVAATHVRADDVVIAEWVQRQRDFNWNRPAGPAGSLAAIAASTQNIHAPAVVEQAKRGMEFLLAVKVPEGQQDAVLDELAAFWPAPRMAPLRADIRMWWNKETCFTPGDWMYRRLLTGLWTYIKSQEDAERRTELGKRMFEECTEAMKMCCQGHTNRLVNVLGGFVEGIDIAVKQSKGEILQQRFAVIGNIEDEEERYVQATQVLAELGVGADEAGPWLDAIAAD